VADMDSDSETGEAPRGPRYAYKPALMGAFWELELKPEGLAWSYGRHSGVAAYGRIARVRLSFRPMTMQSYRFLAEIWSPDAPKIPIASTTWRSMTDQARQDGDYNAFLAELHRRIAAAGGTPRLTAGMNPVLFWIGTAVFVGASLGLAALTVRALQVGEMAGAAMVAGFFALFVWNVGNFFRRNRPGTYRADALPEAALPRG
jgi:hypothetical protein